jgi:predicted HicB family RNase H-like nuclease
MSPPTRPPTRPIPRLRKVTLRLAPHVHEELVARAEQGQLPVEQLAAQVVESWLIQTRRPQ